MDVGVAVNDICFSVVKQEREIVIETLDLTARPGTLQALCAVKIGLIHVVAREREIEHAIMVFEGRRPHAFAVDV